MPVYVGLLRAVNLGSGTQVRMEALRSLLEKSGLEGVQTLIQSGNVVFRSDARTASGLEGPLTEKVARAFQVKTELFLRSSREWKAVIAGNPFSREAQEDPAHLLLMLLHGTPVAEKWKTLEASIRGRERVQGAGRHAYLVYPDGVGRSKLTNVLIESKLGTSGTARNWNTVLKLGALAEEIDSPSSASQ
jgi:uncharacterized protein (DUF1697 family)